MKQTAVILASSLMLSGVGSAGAGSLSIYEHNGSVMYWFEVGDQITITYEVPRPSLTKAGIHAGTILFKGIYDGPGISGEAYAFKPGCDPAPYQVIGREAESNGIVILRGPGPVRVKGGCDVTGYSAKSPHAELVFRYSETHH